MLHWTRHADRQRLLLTGDTLQVMADPHQVTFLWSYPNMIPLSAMTVRRIMGALEPWPVDRIYGFSAGRQILEDGSAAIAHSAQRYIGQRITEPGPPRCQAGPLPPTMRNT